MNSPDPIIDDNLEVVRRTMTDLKTERDKFKCFVDDMIDGLEEMRASLGQHEEALRQRQEDVDRDEVRLKDALRNLEDRAASWASQQQELDRKVVEADTLRKEITDLQKQRDDARERLDEAVEELSSMADMLDLLHSTQEDLDRTRQELEAAKNNPSDSDLPTTEEVEELRQANEQLARDLQESRRRAESLTQKVQTQDEELKKHRQRWSEGLSEMRSAIRQRTSELRSESTACDDPVAAPFLKEASTDSAPEEPVSSEEPTSPGDTTVEQEEPAAATSSDPVVGSVLAQFAKLENK